MTAITLLENLKFSKENLTSNKSTQSSFSSVTITKCLIQNFKFKLDCEHSSQTKCDNQVIELETRLNECVDYILNNNEKIFIKTNSEDHEINHNNKEKLGSVSGSCLFKLNSIYIQKKLIENEKKVSLTKNEQSKSKTSSPTKTRTVSSPNTNKKLTKAASTGIMASEIQSESSNSNVQPAIKSILKLL
jgi:hypothetical protein